jgi:hypothetical protein
MASRFEYTYSTSFRQRESGRGHRRRRAARSSNWARLVGTTGASELEGGAKAGMLVAEPIAPVLDVWMLTARADCLDNPYSSV